MLSVTDNRQPVYSFMLISGLIVIGMATLFSVYAMWAFELKWALFSFLGILFPFVLASLKNARRFILAMLVFSIPLGADYHFVLHPSPGGANGITIGLAEVMLFTLIIHTLISSVRIKSESRLELFPVITVPTLAIIAISLLSLIKVTDFEWALFDIVTFVKVLLFFIFFANNLQSEEDIRLVIRYFFLGLLIQSVIIAFQYYEIPLNLHRFGLGEPPEILEFKMESSNVARPGGTIGHCNHLARYIGLLLPVAMILAFTDKSRGMRLFSALVSSAGIAALIFTLTRSSWMGAVLSAMVMAPLMLAHRLFNLRNLGKILLALLIAAVILGALGDIVYERIVSDDAGSAYTRWTTAKVAFNIIKDHPFLGVGINNYGTVLEDYWLPEDTFTRKAAVHNTYLLVASEIGIIGFGAYLWLLVAFFVRTRKVMRIAGPYYVSLAIGTMGGLAAFALTALSDKSYKESYPVLLLFWAMAAIIEAMIKLTEKEEEQALFVRSGRRTLNDLS